jgi:hypothetical protein
MGIKKAEFTFAAAAEKAHPDRQGRSAAFSKLLTEVQRAAEAAGWKVLTFGNHQLNQIAIGLPPDGQQLSSSWETARSLGGIWGRCRAMKGYSTA